MLLPPHGRGSAAITLQLEINILSLHDYAEHKVESSSSSAGAGIHVPWLQLQCICMGVTGLPHTPRALDPRAQHTYLPHGHGQRFRFEDLQA